MLKGLLKLLPSEVINLALIASISCATKLLLRTTREVLSCQLPPLRAEGSKTN